MKNNRLCLIALLLLVTVLSACDTQETKPDNLDVAKKKVIPATVADIQKPLPQKKEKDEKPVIDKDSSKNMDMDKGRSSFFVRAYYPEGNVLKMELGMAVAFMFSDQKCYLLTNRHVIKGATILSLSPWAGIPAKGNPVTKQAELVYEDQKLDIAVVRYKDKTACSTAKINKGKSPTMGSGVVAYGQPANLKGMLTKGVVSGFWDVEDYGTLMISDVFVAKGNSGGGLFSLNDQLLGIVVGKTKDFGLSYIIPIDRILPIIEQYTKHNKQKNNLEGGLQDPSGAGKNRNPCPSDSPDSDHKGNNERGGANKKC